MGIKKQIIFLFVLAVPVMLLYPSLPGEDLAFRHLSIGDGLSQSIVNCIFQDSRAFMWFGTYNGLNKYDGRKFTVYQYSDRNPKSLSNNTVQCLYEDRAGVLWVGTEGGLNRFDPESETFTHFRHDPTNPTSLTGDLITVLHEDRKGNLWIATGFSGLNKFNPKTGTFIHFDNKCNGCLSGDSVWCLFEDHHGFLWIGTGNGLNRYDLEKDTFTHFFNTDSTRVNTFTNRIRAFLVDKGGNYWAGTEEGLFRFFPESGVFKVTELGFKPASANRGLFIKSLYEGADGIIWVGTNNNGLFLLDPVTMRSRRCRVKLNSTDRLNHFRVLCINEDSSGLIWVGTGGGGLNIYDGRKSGFHHFQRIPGKTNSLNNNSIWAFQNDSRGRLWIGTGGGGINCIDYRTGKYTYYINKEDDESSLSNNFVESFCRDHMDIMWIGTLRGVNRYNRGRDNFNRFLPREDDSRSLSHHRIFRILEDRDRILWFATDGGLNRFHRRSETFTRFLHDPTDNHSLSSDHIREIYQGRNGELWIGTVNGLNKFNKEDGTFTRFTASPGCSNCLSANNVRAIHEDRSGIIWIGTNNGGLNRFSPTSGTFISYAMEDGLPGNTVYCILEDNQRNLWLSTNRGISRFTPTTGYFCNFDVHDGLRCYEFNSRAGYINPGGEMFFGGLYGFVSFFPDQIMLNRYVPPVVITRVDIIDSTSSAGNNSGKIYYPGKKKIELSYKDRIFAVNFAALDYSQPEKNQYKYKLEGLTSKWIPLGTTSEVTFSNLSHGKYLFRVRGSNNHGIWSDDEAALTIFIKPPFWGTWWFKSLCLLLLLMLFYSWHQWRMKSFRLKLKTEEEMAAFFKKYNMTNREKEVVNLVLKGKSNKQIEDELFISLKTVTSHIYNIYRKLGVKNRVEMIRKVKGIL